MPRRALVLAILAALAAAAAGGAGAETRCRAATLAEARAMAERAAAALLDKGPIDAFRRFADPEGGFIDRDLYVFVLDLEGRMWFNAVFPYRPGADLSAARDRQGRYFVREMIETAERRGAGWVEYEWISPCSGEMEPKSAYVVRVGPLLVAVGAYGALRL